jgi:hypothetical protein
MDEATKHCKTRKGFVDIVELAYVPYGYHTGPSRQGIRSFFQQNLDHHGELYL